MTVFQLERKKVEKGRRVASKILGVARKPREKGTGVQRIRRVESQKKAEERGGESSFLRQGKVRKQLGNNKKRSIE